MRALFAIAPMTQLNTPYPSTSHLMGQIRESISCEQVDFSLELFLKIFSKEGLSRFEARFGEKAPCVKFFKKEREPILQRIDPVIRFLQGQDATLAYRIVSEGFLPSSPRLRRLSKSVTAGSDELFRDFGSLGLMDHAKYLASLFLDDLAEFIRDGVDPRFELSRYAEKLSASQPQFERLREQLESDEPTQIDQFLDELVYERLKASSFDAVLVSAPFAGNVYGAFRIARTVKKHFPEMKTVLGGGYPNTELRALRNSQVFDYFDYITLDDGEAPLCALLEHWNGAREKSDLIRTYYREEGRVIFVKGGAKGQTVRFADLKAPDMSGLDLSRYISLLEMPNPMHRLWSDGKWNKLTLAHGCYWKKCTFCDTSLDYIGRYEPSKAAHIVDQMQAMMKQTGQSGFHFVDEAAPPALLKAVSAEIIKRGISVSWWGNVRFEKTFTPALAKLMAASGCIALTGGLEVASDRVLKLINKGVTFKQVFQVTKALSRAGILVHAYLMYGFPSETVQESMESLDRVRKLFAHGHIQSAYWHRFALTAHSPVGLNPKRYGVEITGPHEWDFARNDLSFIDKKGCSEDELEWIGQGLRLAVYNYMRGQGLDEDVGIFFKAPSSR